MAKKKIVAFLCVLTFLVSCFAIQVSAIDFSGVQFNYVKDGFELKYGSSAGAVSTNFVSASNDSTVFTNDPTVNNIAISMLNQSAAVKSAPYWMIKIPFSLGVTNGSGYGDLTLNISLITMAGSSSGAFSLASSSFNGMYTYQSDTPIATPDSSHVGKSSISIKYKGQLPTSGYIQLKLSHTGTCNLLSINTLLSYSQISELDREKEEAQNAGSGAISDSDQAAAQVSGNTTQITGSFNALVQALSSNTTDAVWTIPTVKMPAIAGVTDEFEMIPATSINFSDYVSMIPNDVMTLIRAICDIALVVFCIKELYNMVQYVLTLKGGSDN